MPLDHIRQSILEEVKSIQPVDDVEEAHINDIVAWITSGADLFRIAKPDKPPKHLVSYFVVVDPDHRSLLLVDHIKAQLWLPTGGHVLPSEHPRTTVIREAEEELNIEAVFLKNSQKPLFATVTTTVGLTAGHVDVSLWYVLRGDKHAFINFDKTEFTDVEWFSFEEIFDMDPVIFDPHMIRFTHKLDSFLKR